MYKCQICNKVAVGRSPTGDWCNACGWMDPCPCDAKIPCPFHDGHDHKFDRKGWCKTKDCPAKKEFQ